MVKAHNLFPANLVFKESRADVVFAAGSQPICAQVSEAIGRLWLGEETYQSSVLVILTPASVVMRAYWEGVTTSLCKFETLVVSSLASACLKEVNIDAMNDDGSKKERLE